MHSFKSRFSVFVALDINRDTACDSYHRVTASGYDTSAASRVLTAFPFGFFRGNYSTAYLVKNYDSIPDELEVYGDNGKPYITEGGNLGYGRLNSPITQYFKFKALASSYNKITLRFINRNTDSDIKVKLTITN